MYGAARLHRVNDIRCHNGEISLADRAGADVSQRYPGAFDSSASALARFAALIGVMTTQI